MKKDIPKPLRIIIFVAAAIWIVAMWVKKDIAATLAAVPVEAAVPMIATSLAVTLVKVALLSVAILLVKWLAEKLGGRKK